MTARAFALLASLALFTPPSGWTADPRLAHQSLPTIWRRDFGGDAYLSSISAVALPLPDLANGTVEQTILQQFRDDGAAVTSSKAWLCGRAATIASILLARGANVEMVFESSNQTSYLVTYSRPRAVADDSLAETFIRNICPASADGLPVLVAPTGWSLVPPQHVVGAWSGPNLGDSIVEVAGLASTSVEDDIDMRLLQISSGDGGDPSVSVTRKPDFTVCDRRVAEVIVAMKSPTIDTNADVISMQGPRAAYTLIYTTFQPAFDPNAIAALHAFCPG
jgi:hypothetical protein